MERGMFIADGAITKKKSRNAKVRKAKTLIYK